MSAIFVLPQSSAVHMMVDAVSYTRDGIVCSANLAKASVIATLPVAISCTGPAVFRPLLAERIAMNFDSFDDLIEAGGDWLRETFDDLSGEMRDGDATSSVYLIGWHARQNRPAAYAMDLWSERSSRIEQVMSNTVASAGHVQSEGSWSALSEQTSIAGTPLPSEKLIEHCKFKIRRSDDYRAEVDLLHLAEIARSECIEGAHWVGGKALLTTIDAQGIHQKIVHHWTEDEPGKPIKPKAINDWEAWRLSRTTASLDVAGLSRLQRERMEKKARKGTLRS